uniref:Jag family protein n=1 Tax=Trichocoleus desertorum TaxID=1481672 RepID=UPI0025B41A61|nr:R3H domain-containing nucleic acid-binding protein [Trichocoleus desertorum]
MQQGREWLQELLTLVDLPVDVQVAEQASSNLGSTEPTTSNSLEDRANYWLTIDETELTPEQIQQLTGTNGAVLDAIQYLANTILNLGQAEDQQKAYTIELAGYRARRQAELQAMAEQAAEQVRQTGQEVEMKALSSAERRQIHTFLQSYPDLETYSRGREPDRRLVVKQAQTEPS